MPPELIIWENMGVSHNSKYIRIALITIAWLVILALMCLVVAFCET